MPAILTHYSFAKSLLSECTKGYEKAIYIGTQGPDPFFFYGQLPWKRRSADHLKVNAFGSFLHHTDIAPIYEKMMEIASKDEKHKDLYFAYIEGLWLHYCLDRSCHAYIFPASGFALKKEDEKRYSILHCYFETMIDSLISHEAGTYSTRPQKYLAIRKDELEAISLLWNKTNDATLKDPSIHENTFACSLMDYRSVLRMTNTPHLCSKILIRLLMGKESQPAVMNIPYSVPKKFADVDFLNEKHDVWLDMISGEEHNESFAELMNKAKSDFLAILPIIERAKKGDNVLNELHEFVGTLCHDGCDPSLTKRFPSSRWPSVMLPK